MNPAWCNKSKLFSLISLSTCGGAFTEKKLCTWTLTVKVLHCCLPRNVFISLFHWLNPEPTSGPCVWSLVWYSCVTPTVAQIQCLSVVGGAILKVNTQSQWINIDFDLMSGLPAWLRNLCAFHVWITGVWSGLFAESLEQQISSKSLYEHGT